MRSPWNKGPIVGQKRPLLPKHVWSIRLRSDMADNPRDLADQRLMRRSAVVFGKDVLPTLADLGQEDQRKDRQRSFDRM